MYLCGAHRPRKHSQFFRALFFFFKFQCRVSRNRMDSASGRKTLSLYGHRCTANTEQTSIKSNHRTRPSGFAFFFLLSSPQTSPTMLYGSQLFRSVWQRFVSNANLVICFTGSAQMSSIKFDHATQHSFVELIFDRRQPSLFHRPGTMFSVCTVIQLRHVSYANLHSPSKPTTFDNYYMRGFYRDEVACSRNEQLDRMCKTILLGHLRIRNFQKWPEKCSVSMCYRPRRRHMCIIAVPKEWK